MSGLVPVLVAGGGVACLWLIAVSLHVGYLRWSRGRSAIGSAAVLAGLILAGGAALWLLWQGFSVLRVGAACLYLAGCIVYLELRSLLSRGYSLRILMDLLARGEGERLDQLQEGYGNGRGLRGLLDRRIAALARMRLLRYAQMQVGPLTRFGWLCATVTVGMRRLLRMDLVG